MWHAITAELAYFRNWLLGAFGIALAVAALVTTIFWLVDDGPDPFVAAAMRGFYLVMAPMIVGFIVQSYRVQERRARLLLSGPFTPRQLAGVTLALPTILLGLGALASGVAVGAEILITGTFARESTNIVAYVGGLMFMMNMMGLLALESLAARRQQRRRVAVAGWAAFVAAALLLVALSVAAIFFPAPEGFLTWTHLNLANLVLAVAAAAAYAAMLSGRTDFTR